jgi:TrmH family RNA methyltransferase
MLTAHKIKIFNSLDKKKFRQKYNLFLVEGNKIITELKKSSYKIKEIFSINPSELDFLNTETHLITERELKKISFLQSPKDSVAVVELPETRILENQNIQIILDGLQDPGNLGTIIRLADWFGIEQIVCSADTVDLYNPKVVQSTKGSLARVNVFYTDLNVFLKKSSSENIGTDMIGESIYDCKFPEKFNLILGNEGNGMRPEVEKLVSKNITIPRFGKTQSTESLNVSMATSIILGQIFSEK